MVKLWIWTDTGPSGHGTVGREFVKHLLPYKDKVQLAVYTHQWGMPFRPSAAMGIYGFPDKAMEQELMQTGRINKGYLLKEIRDLRHRTKGLLNDVVSMRDSDKDSYLMIKDFEGDEDIALSIGGLDMARGLPKDSKYKIAETCFNPLSIPEAWLDLDDYCDEIWIPNEWNKTAFLANPRMKYEDKLQVIPYGIEFWEPQPNTLVPKLNDDKFNFVCASRWANMKGWDVLLKAFIEEFHQNENVRLFIKTTLNQQAALNDMTVGQAVKDLIGEMRIPDPPEIGIDTRPFGYQDMFDLYGACDCAVLPHRAEGVGRFQAEAMGTGLPTITTNWGGPAEFIDETNSFPLKHSEPEQVKKKCDWLWFYHNEFGDVGQLWVEPDQQHLQELMRKVFEMSPEKRKAIGEKAKESVRKHFDWSKHIQTRMKRLQEVA
jgi:glycosyltransferase involved in cell wall biosynthesis